MDERLDAVFIYGTLLPGEERWPVLEPFAVDLAAAWVRGALYDTGHGYPAAIFTEPGRIDGSLVRLDAARLVPALAALDEAEAVEHGLYVRTMVASDHGPAWSYEYRGGIDRLVPIGSRWRDSTKGQT